LTWTGQKPAEGQTERVKANAEGKVCELPNQKAAMGQKQHGKLRGTKGSSESPYGTKNGLRKWTHMRKKVNVTRA